MARKVLLLCTCLLLLHLAYSQESAYPERYRAIKWAPAGLLFGSLIFQGEYNLKNSHSFTLKAGLPLAAHHTFTYDNRDTKFRMEATSFQVGFRTYFNQKQLAGINQEPYFKYLKHKSIGAGEGNLMGQSVIYNFTNLYEGNAFGLQLGIQWLLSERWVIDLFLFGPEINASINSFSAVETTNESSWTPVQAYDAERDMRDFLNKFPFLKNRFEVMTDPEKRRVDASFTGTLPGIRTGVSIGFAF
ncbi:MAG TPA: hypothetical protein VER36_07980 [Flavisolibacter sp.]|nr:hypothetical protein [Flavisolibacter sp.]